MRVICFLCLLWHITTSNVASAQVLLPPPPAVALPPGIALVEETEHAKTIVCKGLDRIRSCEREFDRLIAQSRELASIAHAAIAAERAGSAIAAQRALRELKTLTEEFRLSVRAVLTRYSHPQI